MHNYTVPKLFQTFDSFTQKQHNEHDVVQFGNIILTVNEVDDQPALLIHHVTISKSDDPHVSIVLYVNFKSSLATLYRFDRPGNLTSDLRTDSDVM